MFFQIDHSEAAAVLMRKWAMSESLIEPVLWHHRYEEIPKQYILETALVQFVDWVDSKARDILLPFQGPSPGLLNAAGIGELNKIHWVTTQRKTISLTDQEIL